MWTINHVPKSMSYHKATVVITVRGHCFHDCIYIYIYIYIYNASTKKSMEELCLMIPLSGAKFEEKLGFCLKNDKSLVNFDPSTKTSKEFAPSLVSFVQSIQRLTLKIQRSYISWHLSVKQNFKKNWLVLWKMTWEIWQIFIRTLESVKIGIFMGSFCPK